MGGGCPTTSGRWARPAPSVVTAATCDSGRRTTSLPTKQHLYAIAGSSPSDIWVAGDEGTVFHYDGTAWKRVKVAGLGARRPRLDRIWMPSPGKVWIAGQGALVSLGGKP